MASYAPILTTVIDYQQFKTRVENVLQSKTTYSLRQTAVLDYRTGLARVLDDSFEIAAS